MKIIDISPVIDSTIGVWPGDTPFHRTVNLDLRIGDNITLSDIRTTLHVGAHADAPSHYTPDGADIASRSLDIYLGPCHLIHLPDLGPGARIVPADLEGHAIRHPRILFRTDSFPDHRNWNEIFNSLSPELVDHLDKRGVVLVGLDTPSVDPFDSKDLEAHQALARCDMANLEGLALAGAEEGDYELIALPLRIAGADASPVRAVLRRP